MVACAIFGCTHRTSDKNKKQIQNETTLKRRISFFRFPKNADRRAEWISAIRRKNWEPTEKTVICSTHFTEDCFEPIVGSVRFRLRESAVPTVLPHFPAHFQKRIKLKTALKENTDTSTEPFITSTTEQFLTIYIKEEVEDDIKDESKITPVSSETMRELERSVEVTPPPLTFPSTKRRYLKAKSSDAKS